jgi:LysR family transcriptional regulator, transcriptional activator of nhaA
MQLNFQHLYYFWVVARAASLTSAAKRLELSPSTVSTQIKALEDRLGHQLFERRGRGLVLTERGRVALAYADDIFALGSELFDSVRMSAGSPNHLYRLRVGVSNNLPKLVAYTLLAPATRCEEFPVHMVCLQGEASALVADLAVHHFDLVITDQPVGLASDLPIESRLLGECGVTLMGAPELVGRLSGDFPACLDGAPLLLPEPDAQMRRHLEVYFHDKAVHPQVMGEFGDSALLKSFGQAGVGLFPVPTLVAEQVAAQYKVVQVGELEGVREQFYLLLTASRELSPPLLAIIEAAG